MDSGYKTMRKIANYVMYGRNLMYFPILPIVTFVIIGLRNRQDKTDVEEVRIEQLTRVQEYIIIATFCVVIVQFVYYMIYGPIYGNAPLYE